MGKRLWVTSVDKGKLLQLGFKDTELGAESESGEKLSVNMGIRIPDTFRHMYILLVAPETELCGVVRFVMSGDELLTLDTFLDRMAFRAPKAAEWTRELIKKMVDSGAVTLSASEEGGSLF